MRRSCISGRATQLESISFSFAFNIPIPTVMVHHVGVTPENSTAVHESRSRTKHCCYPSTWPREGLESTRAYQSRWTQHAFSFHMCYSTLSLHSSDLLLQSSPSATLEPQHSDVGTQHPSNRNKTRLSCRARFSLSASCLLEPPWNLPRLARGM